VTSHCPLASCPSWSPGHHRVRVKLEPPPPSSPHLGELHPRVAPLLWTDCASPSPFYLSAVGGHRPHQGSPEAVTTIEALPPLFPPPHRWPTATVSRHPPILAQRVILLMLILMSPELENLLAWAAVGHHACAACALSHWPIWPLGQVTPSQPWADSGPALFPFLNFFFKLKSSRNSYNLLEFIENKLKLRKIRNKFIYNPCE
jgi:hypothetical protein